MPPRAAAARRTGPSAEDRARDKALRALKDAGNLALGLARGGSAANLTVTQVADATDAVRHFAASTSAWTEVGEEGLAGIAALFALALRRSGIQAEGISDSLRVAYVSLRHELALAFEELRCDSPTNTSTTPPPLLPLLKARLLCAALLKGGLCAAYAALANASASALLPQRPHPSRRSLQAAKDLLEELDIVLCWVCRVCASNRTASNRYTGPNARASVHFDIAVTSTFNESPVWEHWARLILAVAGCEGSEDTAAAETDRLGSTLSAMQKQASSQIWRPPVEPCLPYLLTSHLVALAAALDGGPTYGLPLEAASAGGAGPSTSAAPVPGSVLPLASKDGKLLQTGAGRGPGSAPASIELPLQALQAWEAALGNESEVLGRGTRGNTYDPLPEPFRPPPPPPPTLYTVREFARGACAAALQQAEAREAAVGAREGEDAALVETLFETCEEEVAGCSRMQAALERCEVIFDWAAAFEVGMRLAGAAAVQLCRMGVFAEGEASLRSLHAPSAWRPAQGPAQPQPPAARLPAHRLPAALLLEADAVTLGLRGLRLARKALAVPQKVYDPPRGYEGPAPAWLRRRLVAWWRAALAWGQQGLPAGWDRTWDLYVVGYSSWRESLPARPCPDVAAALSAGFVPAIERRLRHPTAFVARPSLCAGLPSMPDLLSAWSEVLAFSDQPRALAFVASAGKRLQLFAQDMAKAQTSPGLEKALEVLDMSDSFACIFTPGGGLPLALVRYPGASALPEGWPVVTSAVAARLLLPLASILFFAIPKVLPLPAKPDESPTTACFKLFRLAVVLLSWVPTLVAARFPPVAAAGAPQGPDAGGTAAAAAAGSVGAGVPAAGADAGGPAADAGAPGRADGDVGWGRILFSEVCVLDMLGKALALLPASKRVVEFDHRQTLEAALWALVSRAPVKLAEELASNEGWEAQKPSAKGAIPLLTRRSLRRALGPGGPLPAPELLAAVERACDRAAAGAGAAAGGGSGPSGSAAAGGSSGGGGVDVGVLPEEVRRYAAAPSLLLPHQQAEALLPGCAHAHCTNLEGPSEAALPCEEGRTFGLVSLSNPNGPLRFCSPHCVQAALRVYHRRALELDDLD
ncbi:hypothetical protein HYH03_016914 [Edaphochlamys debaryana]|uniref:Uncharacterized protein n=1 Tax=Edaphochlamys debaryana TaxID=47281 RepID=A0A836BPN2_9CHLO|nr:hypothetical protein HYH03_016914 [Edaphochlamys debaryana]|eukprot:KAG2484270.1 hypothetical protein HYH03_016914 [Edaphochlamys debaryana]